LNVAAKDLATSKAQSIRIEASSGLSEQDIQKMVKDAQAHTTEDRQRREEAEAKNKADQLVYETEKNLKEMADKISADDKAKMDAAIGRVKEALKGSDVNEIKSSTEALVGLWSEVAKTLYQGAAAGSAPTGQATGGPSSGQEKPGEDKDGAVDADYEVVD
jgi:molecular chaperone DnaK